MKCPKCGTDKLSVVDSRGESTAIRRRRECQECNLRFTTYERIEVSLPMVSKKDGRRESFDMDKLRSGVVRACEKRPISVQQIDEMIATVERRIQELCVKEMPSIQIGDYVMEELKHLDHIAYIRFASVYQEFSDIEQFVDTLEALAKEKKAKRKRARKKIEKISEPNDPIVANESSSSEESPVLS